MTRKAFHQELRDIEESVIQMASLVEAEIAQAMLALSRRDVKLAEDVIAKDGEVNEMQRTIRSHCIALMALQAPVARDLRELVTVQLVINELERMGDHAVSIAKQSMRLKDYEPLSLTADLVDMAKIVREQVRACIQAFVDVNVQLARETCANDDRVDQPYRKILAEVIRLMSSEPDKVAPATSLLFIAHDLERIGDRVTNIGEDVIYMVTGEIEELN
ncbi:MAG TPA: phosphate signaling complex protein PhoU [Ktedonobacterales bacterium]|nr:phosphate signaling complex protein PhoU [Ktedonobacterales bacterium]